MIYIYKIWLTAQVNKNQQAHEEGIAQVRAAPSFLLYEKKGVESVTPRQEKFCIEYLKDLSGTRAAIRAGYKESSARYIASRLLATEEVQDKIASIRKFIFKKDIMQAEEVEYLLSKAARGELDEKVLVSEDVDGVPVHKLLDKPISARDRLKALELMGRRNGIFTDKVKVDGEIAVSIQDRLKKAREKASEEVKDDTAGC